MSLFFSATKKILEKILIGPREKTKEVSKPEPLSKNILFCIVIDVDGTHGLQPYDLNYVKYYF